MVWTNKRATIAMESVARAVKAMFGSFQSVSGRWDIEALRMEMASVETERNLVLDVQSMHIS